MKKRWFVAIVVLCFLLGWDIGVTGSNHILKQRLNEQKEYIESLEEWIGSADLVKVKNYMERESGD